MEEDSNDKELKDSIKDSTKGVFKRWNDKAKIKSGDSFATILKKILIRIGGILFLIIFSPGLILALILAFLLAL